MSGMTSVFFRSFMTKKIILLLVTVIIGCNSDKTIDEPNSFVLVKIGSKQITSEEFILNYEFGFNQNKSGEDHIRNYLYLMIDELIIAQHGYKLKIDTTQHIKDAISNIMEERIIEEVFNQEVLKNIEVSEHEIRQEINKAAVSFQLKFMPAMSESHAGFLKQEMDQKGYDEIFTEYSNEMMAEQPGAGDFTTPFMTSDQIDPQLMDIISDLELQTISEPVFYNNQWMLIMVENIRRTPIAPEDYNQQRETYRKVVYNRKALQGAEEFVAQMMEPLNVTTKRAPFKVLTNAFFEWFVVETPTGDLVKKVENGDETYHQEIKNIFDETLVSWASQEWSVFDFLIVILSPSWTNSKSS